MKRLPPRLALVLPCYNEEEVLADTDRTLSGLLDRMIDRELVASGSCIVYTDDGSRDSTWQVITTLCRNNPRAAGVRLAANSGHQNCVLAGMEYASTLADAVITIDADLQDDVEAIPEMVRKYREGADVVYGVRDNRDSDTPFKRHTAQMYYRILRRLGVNSVYNHADFRLLSARALADLMRYDERNVYLRGIVPLLGYKQECVTYARKPRMAGTTKYPLKKMVNLAMDGITSFSVKPVRMVSAVGLVFVAVAVVMLVYTLARYFTGATIEGWASLMLSLWFCSGVILLALGIVGEYIGKIYTEVKHRPRYSVSERIDAKDNQLHVNNK